MVCGETKALVSVGTDGGVTGGKSIGKRNRSTPINVLTFKDSLAIQSIALDI